MTVTRKTLVLLLATTALTATLLAANALADGTLNQANPSGKLISVNGRVLVNGQAVLQGDTINADSTGKLGRVEVLNSNMKLTFDNGSVTAAMLDQGRARISSSSNVGAHATTSIAEIRATDNRRNKFIVDTSCGNTFVSILKGAVELRAGSTVKQIAVGNQHSAGTARPRLHASTLSELTKSR